MLFFFFFFNSFFKIFFYLFMIVKEREREAETQAEGEAGSMHRESDVGLDPRSPGSHPGPKAGAKLLRHPGIPWSMLFLVMPFSPTQVFLGRDLTSGMPSHTVTAAVPLAYSTDLLLVWVCRWHIFS